jgi:hypothetical protein
MAYFQGCTQVGIPEIHFPGRWGFVPCIILVNEPMTDHPKKRSAGREMTKKMNLCLALLCFLVAACTSTPTPENTPPPSPTPRVEYQIVGRTKNIYMVVVDPKSSTDREGLQELSDQLCIDHANCKIWYWDDIQKADTTYPVDPANEKTVIAVFTLDVVKGRRDLVIFALGDQ